MIKVDVELLPGDKVDLHFPGSDRHLEKVVEAVDNEGDIVHFTDGTRYNHKSGMILIPPKDRPKVLKIMGLYLESE